MCNFVILYIWYVHFCCIHIEKKEKNKNMKANYKTPKRGMRAEVAMDEEGGMQMSLYEMNQNFMASQEPLQKETIKDNIVNILKKLMRFLLTFCQKKYIIYIALSFLTFLLNAA